MVYFLGNNIDVDPTLQNSSFISTVWEISNVLIFPGCPQQHVSSLRSVGMALQRHTGSTAISLLFF